MKIFNFLFVVLFKGAFSDKLILSKFFQHDYKIKNIRVELKSYNKEIMNFAEIKNFKYNRTTTAQNYTYNFKVDVENKLEVIIQMYKFLSNEYRHFPVRFEVNFCKAVDANTMGLKGFYKCGNFTTCRYKKNITYHVCNFVKDVTRLPPNFPNGMFMVDAQFMYLDKPAYRILHYGEVYRPINEWDRN